MKKIKAVLRKAFDGFFCRSHPHKKEIGHVDSWFVLNDKLKNAVVYSGGAGKDITFEISLAKDFGAQVFLFDPSPTGAKTVENLNGGYPNIHFFPYGLAGEEKVISFSLPDNPEEGSYTVRSNNPIVEFPCKTLSTIIRNNGHTSVEIVKLDIEGFEYDVLPDLLSSGIKVRQIVLEFHHFFDNISIFKTLRSVRLLQRHGYKLIHKRGHDYSFFKKG